MRWPGFFDGGHQAETAAATAGGGAISRTNAQPPRGHAQCHTTSPPKITEPNLIAASDAKAVLNPDKPQGNRKPRIAQHTRAVANNAVAKNPEPEGQYECDVCNATYATFELAAACEASHGSMLSTSELAPHAVSHYLCDVCGEAYASFDAAVACEARHAA